MFFVFRLEKVWRQLAEELGGRFWQRGHALRVEVDAGDRVIALDGWRRKNSYSCRLFAPFVNPERLWFSLRRSRSSKANEQTSVQVGDPAFDCGVFLQTNAPAQTVRVFSDAAIRELVLGQRTLRLGVDDHAGISGPRYGPDVDALVAVEFDHASLPCLRGLFSLYPKLLNQLCARRIAAQNLSLPEGLEPGTPTGLIQVFRLVEDVTRSYPGRPHRVGDAIAARLEHEALSLFALLTVGAPTLPQNACDLRLEGGLPPGPPRRDLEPFSLDRALGPRSVVWSERHLIVRAEKVPFPEVRAAATDAIALWRRAAEERAAFR